MHELVIKSECNNTHGERIKNVYTNRGSAKCWLDIYRCGAGLAVIGRVRDIGQSFLQSASETVSTNSPHLLPDFFADRL